MHLLTRATWLLTLAAAACAPRYTYTFQVEAPAPDPDLAARVEVDDRNQAVELDLANQTDQVLQVAWDRVTLRLPDGRASALRPGVDLGWIPAGGRVVVALSPVALPHAGDAAAANDGRDFELDVPVIVRREPRTYRFTFTAHVREI